LKSQCSKLACCVEGKKPTMIFPAAALQKTTTNPRKSLFDADSDTSESDEDDYSDDEAVESETDEFFPQESCYDNGETIAKARLHET